MTIAWISVTYQDGVQKICSIIQDYKHLEPQKEEKEHKLLIFQGGLKFVENEFFSKDFSNYNTVWKFKHQPTYLSKHVHPKMIIADLDTQTMIDT